jgi:hypothetical protein
MPYARIEGIASLLIEITTDNKQVDTYSPCLSTMKVILFYA